MGMLDQILSMNNPMGAQGLPQGYGMLSLPQTYGFDGPPPDAAAEAEAARQAATQRQRRSVTQREPPAFGPFPGVPVPGMQNDLAPSEAAPAAPSAPALPGWLGDMISAPSGIGGPQAPQSMPPPQAAPRPPGMSLDETAYGKLPDDPAALPPNATPASAIPTPALPGAAPAQPPGFGQRLKGGLENIAGILSPAMRERQVQNQTEAALVKAGMDPETARAAAGNPDMLKSLLPSLFGSKLTNINGVMVDQQGRKVADYSEAGQWKPTVIKNPKTGEDETVLLQPSTGAIKPVVGNGFVQPRTNGPATGNMTLPPEVKAMPPAQQFRNAPDGSTATLGGRPVVKRAGRWEYVE